MSGGHRRPRGFVLAAVVFALAMVAALTAGAFFAALQEARAGANAAALLRARGAAAAGIHTAFAAWPAALLDSLSPGATADLAAGTIGGASYVASARRAGPELFLLAATGTDPATGSERGMLAIARLKPLVPPVRAALRLRGDLDSDLASRIDGADHTPPGWICPSGSGDGSGGGGGGGGTSAPAVSFEPGADDSVFLRLGSMSWNALETWAAVTGGGGDSLPLRHVAGAYTLDAGRSRGTLLVDGDLTLRGGAEFVGILLVRGSLVFGPGGASVWGEGVAGNAHLLSGADAAVVRVVFSACAVDRAARSRAPVRPLPGGASPAWF